MAPSPTLTSSSDDENRARIEEILRDEEQYGEFSEYGRWRAEGKPDVWTVLFGVLIFAVLGAGVMAAVWLARLANSEPVRLYLGGSAC